MQFFLKVAVSLGVILAATAIARRFPAAGGLVGVMPLAGVLILIWVYLESSGDPAVMEGFTKGALWGILPSILFYLIALYCFRKGFSLTKTLVSSFAAWAVAAVIHQWMLK